MVWTLVGLAGAGFVISSYVTGVAFRWVRPDARWVPPVCRMEEETCALVVFTPQARLFGPPNSVLGQLFYVALAVAVLTGALEAEGPRLVLQAVSLGTVLLGGYLTYALLFINRVHCVLCYLSHVINVGVFVLLLLA
tara:strand:+ start:183 stop:593 length:411 start_codon:yes stop_codon:yes gene_type:complete